MTARCPLHQRPSEQTCTRCGTFVCDWCVKLAPDWGPGLCHECLRRDPPRTAVVRLTLTTGFLVALLGLMGLASSGALLQSLFDSQASNTGRAANALGAVIGFVGAGVVIAMNRHRR